jgi:hypothetical protein
LRSFCHVILVAPAAASDCRKIAELPIFAANVFAVRTIPEADGDARAPGASGRTAWVPVAFCTASQAAVHRAVRGRILRGADRRGDSLVHGADRHVCVGDSARSLPGANLAMARGDAADRRGRAAERCAGALPHHQSGDRGAVLESDPLAGALARRAPELVVLPERFRRPHLQSRDADRPGGAPDAGLLGDRGLVRAGLRHHRRGDDGGCGCVAHRADPRLVCRLCRAVVVFRAADARPLQDQFRGALGADGPHRRQLHEYPDGETVRAPARRGQLRARRVGPPRRRLPGRAAPADDVRYHPQSAQRAADRRRRRDGLAAVAEGAGRGRRHRDGPAAHAAAHQHVAPDRGPDHRSVRRGRHRAGRHKA